MTVKKGEWVQIREVILQPEGRAPQVPADTKQTPLTMWLKGHLVADSEIGGRCEIITVTGRKVGGILEEVTPTYTHNFGQYTPELTAISQQVKERLGF